ncbi:hypothetical protein [Polynucleobacter necessarius]|uniref:hypothetical protein n=1 Tax=Polynucleobacter necessarius TaxID=576610 RepID=UPI000E0945D9|nr:hypothetical protein [Polynucleobacter necessarius]
MKQEFTGFMAKLKPRVVSLLSLAKLHVKEYLGQVVQTQNNLYQSAHGWISSRAPSIAGRYDATPNWLK